MLLKAMGKNKGLNDLSWTQTLLIGHKKYMEIENRCSQTERGFEKTWICVLILYLETELYGHLSVSPS